MTTPEAQDDKSKCSIQNFWYYCDSSGGNQQQQQYNVAERSTNGDDEQDFPAPPFTLESTATGESLKDISETLKWL